MNASLHEQSVPLFVVALLDILMQESLMCLHCMAAHRGLPSCFLCSAALLLVHFYSSLRHRLRCQE